MPKPEIHRGDIVHNLPGTELRDGKWVPAKPKEVGPVAGGIGITTNQQMVAIDADHLVNPATGEVFTRTRKDTGFFSKTSMTFVKPFAAEGDG